MPFLKPSVPLDHKNGFFAKVLSSILIFCLLLISLVFLMIYQNVKKRTLEQSYEAEQEVVSNVSYSASIMQDTANSMLSQLNGDPKLLQLIYSTDTENLSTIHAMLLLQNYTRASTWLDSVYIYCGKEDRICFAYTGTGKYDLSFCALPDFFDAELICTLQQTEKNVPGPMMRQVQYRPDLPEKTLFTYHLPVQNSSSHYDGFFIANISAEQLLTTGYSMINSAGRQLLIVDAAGQVYTSGHLVLDAARQTPIIGEILASDADGGQLIARESDAICTWIRSADTGLYFLSCVRYSSITEPLRVMTSWFVLFYIAIVLFAVLISVYLSFRINREYAVLQRRYALSEKRYAENYSYIKQSILRSFFTLKSSDFVIGKQFSDNGIALEQYSGFSLFLFQLCQKESSDDGQPLRYRRSHFLLQEQIGQAISREIRFELVDMLQGRFLLVCEQGKPYAVHSLSEKLREAFGENALFSVSGVYTDSLVSMDQLPMAYRTLTAALDCLYFYPADSLVALDELNARRLVGNPQAERLRSEVIQHLCAQRFDDAAQLLGDFFDEWFEPVVDIPYTLDTFLTGLFEYITTFKRAYAVSLEYNPVRFRMEVLRAERARTVRRLFLELIEDLSCAFASIHDRSNYIDECIGYMKANYADPKLNIDILADHVGLSVSHVQNIFKTATSSSISAYLRKLRLNKATELLEQTNMPISEVAEKTGFGNANYFYTVFKRHYSITPTEYRANHPNLKNRGETG